MSPPPRPPPLPPSAPQPARPPRDRTPPRLPPPAHPSHAGRAAREDKSAGGWARALQPLPREAQALPRVTHLEGACLVGAEKEAGLGGGREVGCVAAHAACEPRPAALDHLGGARVLALAAEGHPQGRRLGALVHGVDGRRPHSLSPSWHVWVGTPRRGLRQHDCEARGPFALRLVGLEAAPHPERGRLALGRRGRTRHPPRECPRAAAA
mmetsp:Transcript_14178/g.42981  ORF Transcript_14178/g.42981 Transcript_14178/m.42981 type:complete len:210 (+) Transcript_14178:991-1620(+)